jgi:adenylyltransferase/sulfurtransferase
MDDAELLRYSRHILLPQIGIDGQQKLIDGRVLVVGMGGLGSPVAMYLAASGVGHLTLVDHDRVDLTNLQRQIVHDMATVGLEKVESAARRLAALNPGVRVTTFARQLTDDELLEQARNVDIVVDTTDNFPARFAVNRACVAARRPLVSGAVTRFEGQVAVFRPDLPDGACYRCLYHESEEPGEPCSQFGVLAAAPGVIGSLQAVETLKLMMGIGETLSGRMLLIDLFRSEWRDVRIRRDPDCPVCGVSRMAHTA